jgi:hypothetical protein
MADRQIFELTTETTPTNSMWSAIQHSTGATEAKKVNIAVLNNAGIQDGDVAIFNSTTQQWESKRGWRRVVLSADVTNNNATQNTLQDVTGLSFAVTGGVHYWFRFFIYYTAALGTTGSRWTLNGPTVTTLIYRSEYSLTATSRTYNEGLNAYSLPAASNATSLTTGNTAIIEGVITPSAAGTVIARFASEVASSAIVAKANLSYLEYGII